MSKYKSKSTHLHSFGRKPLPLWHCKRLKEDFPDHPPAKNIVVIRLNSQIEEKHKTYLKDTEGLSGTKICWSHTMLQQIQVIPLPGALTLKSFVFTLKS